MSERSHNFNIGDSVRVKDGILEPDTEAFSIGGWQGRINNIRDEEGPTVIDIDWDSITLRNMPKDFIEQCEEEGYGWDSMGLYPEDVELAEARDIKEMTIRFGKKSRMNIFTAIPGWGSRENGSQQCCKVSILTTRWA